MLALEDQFLNALSDKRLTPVLSQTHIWLCTLPSQSKSISNIPPLCCNLFHMIFSSFSVPFHSILLHAGKMKTEVESGD